MAQSYTPYGQKPNDSRISSTPPLNRDDDLSRYIDGILDGNAERPTTPVTYANGWPDDFRGWLIFAAMMTLAIWGIAKVWCL